MLIRISSIATIVFLGACATAFGQNNQGVSFLVQEPGSASTAGSYTVYVDAANPLNPLNSGTGPIGYGRTIAKPGGNGFYMIGPGAIESTDGTFASAPRVISGLPGPPTAATMSPDGKTLLVGTVDASNNGLLYLIDTASDQVVGSAIPLPGLPTFQPLSGATAFCPDCFIAVSGDSKTAYVLTNTGIGSRLTSINLTTRAQINQIILTGGATSVALSPKGLLYVTAVNIINEIDPATLAITSGGNIQLFFTPFKLHFTPDGQTAYAVNLVPTSGGSLIKLSLITHQTAIWPTFQAGVTPPTFADVVVAGNTRLFAIDSTNHALYDVSPTPFTATPSTLAQGPNGITLQILAVAASNEIPNAKYLFMVVGNGNQTNLYRINLANNTVDTTNNNVPNYPSLEVVSVPQQSGAATFITFNANQILNTGGAGATLLARVYDVNGLPVYNAAATFTTDAGNGAVISKASSVTGADGSAQASATIPNVPGTYNITLTVGAVSTIFTLTVPGGSGGSGGGGATSQVQIVSGDGQIILQNQTSAFPLTILLTDDAGKPIPNAPVTFTITSGAGFLNSPQTQTDDQGHASSYFTGLQLTVNSTVLPVVINASTQYGSTDFHETIILISVVDGSGIPQTIIKAPTFENARTITAPQGTPVPNAIDVILYATGFPQTGQPLPNVSIFTYNVDDSTKPPVAVCKGSSLSDANGEAKCTLVAACQLGVYQLGISFGNPFLSVAWPIDIVPGGPTVFNIQGGNNQSGVAGQTLSGLTATLTDGCNSPVPINTPVVWKVTSGTATLVNTVSTTDSQGRVSTGVKLGQTPGQVTVTVSSGAITQTFTLTNSVVVGSLKLSSGGGQVAKTGQAFTNPIIFFVKDSNNVGINGITVTFNVNGNGTVNPGSATSDITGKVQTSVTAGSTAGTIVVTASALGFSDSATLTSQLPGPSIINTSFTNAASNSIGMVPCGLGTVVGTGVAPTISGVVSGLSPFGPLPFILGGFSMTVNGVQAPIEAVSNQNGVQQAIYQTPCEISPGLANVVVTVNGSVTQVSNVPVLSAQPGIFTFQGPNNKVYGAIFRGADGTYVTPTNFARRCPASGTCNETYYLVVTGMGQTSPAASTDSVGIPNQNVVLQSVVGINNAGVPVISSVYQPGAIGVYLVAFQIPASAPTGADQPLAVAVILNGQTVFNNQPIFIPGVQ